MKALRLTPATGVNTNPATFATKVSTGLGGLTESSTITFLRTCDAEGQQGCFVLLPDRYNENVQLNLAHAVGARAERIGADEVAQFIPDTRAHAALFSKGDYDGRESQMGVDIDAVAATIQEAMPLQSWVAITLRKPTSTEASRHNKWYRAVLGQGTTNAALGAGAVAYRMTAGAETRREATNLLDAIETGLPGLEIAAKPHRLSRFSTPARYLFLTALMGLLYVVAGRFVRPQLESLLAGDDSLVDTVLSITNAVLVGLPLTVGLITLIAAVSSLLIGFPANPGRALRRAGVTLRWPPPAKLSVLATIDSPTAAHTDNEGNYVEATTGDYPLANDVFINSGQVLIPLINPRGSASSNAAEVKMRTAPAETRTPIGPRLGTSGDEPAFADASSLRFGTMIFGEPGTGKTYLLNAWFGWALGCRSGMFANKPDWPGTRTGGLAFESKDFHGVKAYQQWGDAASVPVHAIDPMNPDAPMLDLTSPPGETLTTRATFLTDLFAYAFGEEAVGPASYDTFQRLFAVALSMVDSPYLAGAEEAGINPNGSVFYFLDLLIGGHGQDVASQAYESFRDAVQADQAADPELVAALSQADSVMKQSPSARTKTFQAPANKIGQIVRMEHMWTRDRPQVSVDDLIRSYQFAVLNLGTSEHGEQIGARQQEQLGAMALFVVKDAIARNCAGWDKTDQVFMLFADELSLLAPHSPEVVLWVRNQGRSFGVWPFFAAQYPQQLEHDVQVVVRSFDNLIAFYSKESGDAAQSVAPLLSNTESDPWSPADIAGLNARSFQVAARLTIGGKQRNTFVVTLDSSAEDRHGWLASHGAMPGHQPAPPAGPTEQTDPVQNVPVTGHAPRKRTSFAVTGQLDPDTHPADAPTLGWPAGDDNPGQP